MGFFGLNTYFEKNFISVFLHKLESVSSIGLSVLLYGREALLRPIPNLLLNLLILQKLPWQTPHVPSPLRCLFIRTPHVKVQNWPELLAVYEEWTESGIDSMLLQIAVNIQNHATLVGSTWGLHWSPFSVTRFVRELGNSQRLPSSFHERSSSSSTFGRSLMLLWSSLLCFLV